ncbi:NAD(P)H-binding protein [Kitasatospora sp. RB6PN24]|uniref:NAD(P)H-binding protein n=1 Tax=Kitasatospora humi TaxID=2893891 RepID=UPI001E57DFB8|nr:NAD(P)H-binding protein [Kitasatospora humi]MCC9310852.1 NAD(P)H-binding protein [Kitasatospora humi]
MIVVTGATGNVGRPLVAALAGRRAGEVVAVSRSAAQQPAGAGHQVADLADPQSLRPALEGAEALFLHDGGAGGQALRAAEILALAEAAGVRRVVLLSSLGVVTRPDSAWHGGVARAVEEAVRASGLDWTVLRPGAFASNAFAWAQSVRTGRTAAAPFGDVGLPLVDPADIAEVAALALGEDGHAGRAYELTGPELSTPRERAAVLGELLGEPVEFVEQTEEQARAELMGMMPEPVVDTTLAIMGAPTPAEQRISPDVEKLLGRPARTFADWAQRHLAAFR